MGYLYLNCPPGTSKSICHLLPLNLLLWVLSFLVTSISSQPLRPKALLLSPPTSLETMGWFCLPNIVSLWSDFYPLSLQPCFHLYFYLDIASCFFSLSLSPSFHTASSVSFLKLKFDSHSPFYNFLNDIYEIKYQLLGKALLFSHLSPLSKRILLPVSHISFPSPNGTRDFMPLHTVKSLPQLTVHFSQYYLKISLFGSLPYPFLRLRQLAPIVLFWTALLRYNLHSINSSTLSVPMSFSKSIHLCNHHHNPVWEVNINPKRSPMLVCSEFSHPNPRQLLISFLSP